MTSLSLAHTIMFEVNEDGNEREQDIHVSEEEIKKRNKERR